MKRVTRRSLGAFAAALGGAEALSLAGGFDHRAAPPATARERVRAALASGERGVVHVGHSTHVVCLGGERFLTDPLAEHLLTASVPGGVARFRAAMAAELPGVRCETPLPGAIVAIG